ncbi:MAG: hypothetical protein ACL7AX_11415 [Candidatus Arsenophonus phytopathogenicus]
MALEKLAELHANKLFKKLDDEDYQKTTQQKVAAFFLSLIPLYSCITEAQKGKIREAIVAGAFDISSFFTLFGQKDYKLVNRRTRLEGIKALHVILTTPNSVMDLAEENLSYIDLARILKGKRDFCQARLHNALISLNPI